MQDFLGRMAYKEVSVRERMQSSKQYIAAGRSLEGAQYWACQ